MRKAVTQDELRAESQVQELIQRCRDRRSTRRLEPAELLAHLEFYCNYEIQRRKTFWVDESLAWMLANTLVDAESRLFRLPFPSYVLVYSDRHTLGVAERELAGGNCPLRGQMLALVCAYLLEAAPDGSRVKAGLTFDAFAGQPPHLMSWELHVDPNATLERTVGDALARPDARCRPLPAATRGSHQHNAVHHQRRRQDRAVPCGSAATTGRRRAAGTFPARTSTTCLAKPRSRI